MRTRPAALLLSALYLWSLGVDALSAQRDAAPLFRVTFYDGRVAVAHDMMMVTIGDRIEIGDRPKLAGKSFEKARIIK